MRTVENLLEMFPGTTKGDWEQHKNGGGWKQKTATVEDTAYVGPDAVVFGSALVYGSAQVYGSARVYGDKWTKTPIQILTDTYVIQVVTHKLIAVGCEHHTYDDWCENIMAIAKGHGLTDQSKIDEYMSYVEIVHKWMLINL